MSTLPLSLEITLHDLRGEHEDQIRFLDWRTGGDYYRQQREMREILHELCHVIFSWRTVLDIEHGIFDLERGTELARELINCDGRFSLYGADLTVVSQVVRTPAERLQVSAL